MDKKAAKGKATAYLLAYTIFAIMVYAIIIALKFLDVISRSWVAVLTSVLWAPPAVCAALLFILLPIALIRSNKRKARIRRDSDDIAPGAKYRFNLHSDNEVSAVKFFEFDDPYYALIAAVDRAAAIGCYERDVCELDDGDASIVEITADEARKRINSSAGPDDEKRSILARMDWSILNGESSALLIDGMLT